MFAFVTAERRHRLHYCITFQKVFKSLKLVYLPVGGGVGGSFLVEEEEEEEEAPILPKLSLIHTRFFYLKEIFYGFETNSKSK